jgi:hypothetical protein
MNDTSKSTDTTTAVERDGLGDWRLQAASRIVADVPAAYPGGPSHKAGSVIAQTTMAATAKHPNLGFITPSATALALSAGLRSADLAVSLWNKVQFQTLVTPDGPGRGVPNIVTLFDYFEEALAAANSSFQAIEAFANATIARLLTGTMTVQRRNGPQQMDAEQIQRQVSTSEKIATILPTLLNAPSIKRGREWQSFDKLKDVRDASTHFKSGDQYPNSGKVAKGSLYDVLLNTDPREFPLTAVRVISKLGATPQPRWLAHLIEKYSVT